MLTRVGVEGGVLGSDIGWRPRRARGEENVRVDNLPQSKETVDHAVVESVIVLNIECSDKTHAWCSQKMGSLAA